MKIGDIVYLCKGHSNILYKAIISSDYYFDSTGGSNGNEIHKFWYHRRNIVNIEPYNSKKLFLIIVFYIIYNTLQITLYFIFF